MLHHSESEVVAVLIQIIANRLSLDASNIQADSHLVDDLHFDSLDLVEVMMDIEDRFQIKMPDTPMGSIFRDGTVRWLANVVIQQALQDEHEQRRPSLREPSTAAPQLAGWTQIVGAPGAPLIGPLHEPISKTADGRRQLRRRSDGMVCIEVPPGSFTRGSSEPEQAPTAIIAMDGYFLDREPVSAGSYARFITAIGPLPHSVLLDWVVLTEDDQRQNHLPIQADGRGWQPKPHCALLPMWLVSWYGANAYSLWAHGCDWRAYKGDGSIPEALDRLPAKGTPPPGHRLGSYLSSEAEWEYAARGSDGRTWPWGAALCCLRKWRVCLRKTSTKGLL